MNMNFDFWAHNPTEDEAVDIWGDCLPVWREPLATGEKAHDWNASAIACLYALRRDTDTAMQYAQSISDDELKSDALRMIEKPMIFDPIEGAIPLSSKEHS
ncbi:MAG: hypothetical protein AB1847_22800 [bacterium]